MSLEFSELLNGIDQLRGRNEKKIIDRNLNKVRNEKVLDALNSFTECVRYLNTRRTGGALLKLDSEAAVQDALYLMLRPWIEDLTPESPTDKIANRFSIKDFCSRSNRIVIEAKYIRSEDHGKHITKEINDDIETYRYHHYCDSLIFFIYDPNALIPDSSSVSRHITTSRVYDGKTLHCFGVIKP